MKEFAANGRTALSVAAIAVLVVFMMGLTTAYAEDLTKHERKLNGEISMLDSNAKLPYGEQVVTEQLTKTFDVKSDRVKALRDKNLGYGEIATVLAFADKMKGGLTDENINKVTKMREGKTGWNQIAKSVKVDLDDIADKVSDIETDAHKDIKKAAAERPAVGRGAGGSEFEESGAGGDVPDMSGERSGETTEKGEY